MSEPGEGSGQVNGTPPEVTRPPGVNPAAASACCE